MNDGGGNGHALTADIELLRAENRRMREDNTATLAAVRELSTRLDEHSKHIAEYMVQLSQGVVENTRRMQQLEDCVVLSMERQEKQNGNVNRNINALKRMIIDSKALPKRRK